MKYYIGEPGSTGRYFDELEEFIEAIKDLIEKHKSESESIFEIEIVRD